MASKILLLFLYYKDTRGKNAPSNKIPPLTKSTNMGIWVVGKVFLRGSLTETKFTKNIIVTGKTPFLLIGPFCMQSPFYLP